MLPTPLHHTSTVFMLTNLLKHLLCGSHTPVLKICHFDCLTNAETEEKVNYTQTVTCEVMIHF